MRKHCGGKGARGPCRSGDATGEPQYRQADDMTRSDTGEKGEKGWEGKVRQAAVDGRIM